MTLPDLLLRSCREAPDADLLITQGGRASYARVLALARGAASALARRGVAPGDRVAVLTDDPLTYVAAYFGVLLAGAVFVGLNTQTSGRSLGRALADSGASALLMHGKFAKYLAQLEEPLPALRFVAVSSGAALNGFERANLEEFLSPGEESAAFPPVDPGAPAQILYTSGSTGEPKGVVLTHANLVANTRSIVTYLALTPRDRVMMVLPFFYAYGNSVLLTHVAAGASLVVHQSLAFPNVVFDLMEREGVTGFSGVPSTYALLLGRTDLRERRFSTLRYTTQAGGPMPPALLRELAEVWPGVDIFVMYGQTEASARLTYLDPRELPRRAGSLGKPIPGVTLRLQTPSGGEAEPGEVGEILARGDNIMAGYWGRPEETAAVLGDGWLHTGDLARRDDEGYYYFVSRATEMIKSGAHRIGPKEIEDVLLEHPAVAEAAVVGVPDAILGESIRAFVILKDGASVTQRELATHCRHILPAFKAPHDFVFREAFPRTASGKVMKSELREAAIPGPAHRA